MIDTDRLLLRPYALEDYAPYLAMWSDPDVVRYLGGPLSAEDAWNKVLCYAGHWALLGHGIFAVIERSTGCYVGETGLADFHRGIGPGFDRSAEAAWVFSRQVQGRGYAFEAAHAAHRWFAATQGASRTVCIINPENSPSLALARKLGYIPYDETTYRGAPVIVLERHPSPPHRAIDTSVGPQRLRPR